MARQLTSGSTYSLRYTLYHVDPAPHLFVLYSDQDYSYGLNLHYLSLIKSGGKGFHRIPESAWPALYDKLRQMGYYKPFLDFLQKMSDAKLSRSSWGNMARLLARKYPFSMLIYRTYKTRSLRIVENLGPGVQ